MLFHTLHDPDAGFHYAASGGLQRLAELFSLFRDVVREPFSQLLDRLVNRLLRLFKVDRSRVVSTPDHLVRTRVNDV